MSDHAIYYISTAVAVSVVALAVAVVVLYAIKRDYDLKLKREGK